MRKSRKETAITNRRIVAAASKRFRKNGIEATALADLMAAAGMTHGGFYRHFESKDQVIQHSIVASLDEMKERLAACILAAPAGNGLQNAVDDYLSTAHRDHLDSGCPLVALGGELSRGSSAVREATTAGLMELVDLLAAQINNMPAPSARKKALVILATMVGAMTMARIVADPALSSQILRAARKELTH